MIYQNHLLPTFLGGKISKQNDLMIQWIYTYFALGIANSTTLAIAISFYHILSTNGVGAIFAWGLFPAIGIGISWELGPIEGQELYG